MNHGDTRLVSALRCDPMSEPDRVTRAVSGTVQTHIRSPSNQGQRFDRFVFLDRPELIGPGGLRSSVELDCQTAFIAAPSITAPVLTYFHSATSNFRKRHDCRFAVTTTIALDAFVEPAGERRVRLVTQPHPAIWISCSQLGYRLFDTPFTSTEPLLGVVPSP